MKNKTCTYLWALLCLLSVSIHSFGSKVARQVPSLESAKLMAHSKDLFFAENKGQLADEKGNLLPEIKYYGHSSGVYLYCKPGMISFVFTKNEQEGEISEATGKPVLSNQQIGIGEQNGMRNSEHENKISTSRTDLIFLNANYSAQIIASDQQEYYENFFTTGDADHGITNVHTFKTLTYKEIYPHIDLVLNTEGSGMEYSFIVHPGGKVKDIKLRWNGTDKTEALDNGGIRYSNSLGTMEESAPKSFVEGNIVESKFITHGNNYGFKVGSYDKTKDLIIDPSLSWGTYYGGDYWDLVFGVSADGNGNVYITGSTPNTAYIATPGAWLTTFASGTENAFVAKFNSSGGICWATYFGGGLLVGYGISTYGTDVYITGGTGGSLGINLNSTAFQQSHGGQSDAFLAKFNGIGILTWATYYGGDSWDNAFGVVTDATGNIYITGQTASTYGTTAMGTYGTHQISYGGGTSSYGYDAFLAKFNSSGSRLWGTYFGGSGDDIGRGVCTDASGNVFITGYTTSISGIAGSIVNQNIYNTTYQGGLNDAFLAKFNGSSGMRIWATYYGGSGADFGLGISTDVSGNVLITGYTNSTSGIAGSIVSQSSFQTSFGGGVNDAYVAKFNSSGVFNWGTYYGGSNIDEGYGVCSDLLGNVYMTGYTMSPCMATSDAHQTSLAYADAILVKFNSSGSRLWATYYGGESEEKSYGISTDFLGNIFIAGYAYSRYNISTYGVYQAVNTSLDRHYDGFVAKFGFGTLPTTTNAGSNNAIPSGSGTQIGAPTVSGSTYSWVSNPIGFTSTVANPFVNPSITTTYTVTETMSNACSYSNSVTITVYTLLTASISKINVTCLGGNNGSINVSASGGTIPYQYSIDGGITYQSSSLFSNLLVGTYIVYVKDANTFSNAVGTINIIQLDNVAPTAICKNVNVTLINGTASITASDINNGSSDACGILSMSVSPNTFNCSNIGSNNVILTVRDNNNNVSTCQATVTVNGVIPVCSIVSAPNTSGVLIGSATTGAMVNQMFMGYGYQSMLINCNVTGGAPFTYNWTGTGLSGSGSSRVFTPASGGNYSISCTITNSYGCQVICTTLICVLDVTAPGGSPTNPKVYLCHVPTGNPNNPQSLDINVNAVDAHLTSHTGDKLGDCAMSCGLQKSKTLVRGIYTVGEVDLIVYPNPSNNSFNFKLESMSEEPVSIKIYDISGRLVYSISNNNSKQIIVLGDELANGTYLAEVVQGDPITNGFRKTVKLVKIQ
ncbi:MAG: SBBP repeat-containing protein [Bacteroidota bacterium]|nr:SBBP repeat-containing protein [Bacteroidota bacterium]